MLDYRDCGGMGGDVVLGSFGACYNLAGLVNEDCLRCCICEEGVKDIVRLYAMFVCFVWLRFVMICLVHVLTGLWVVLRVD